MSRFECWDSRSPALALAIESPMAYQAAQSFAEQIDRSDESHSLSRVVHVRHPEGFVDIFDVELSSTPIYTARRKKP